MRKIIGILFICVFVLSCTQSVDDKQKQLQIIQKMEDTIDSIKNIRIVIPDETFPLTTAYWRYYETFPTDTLSAIFLYRAAEASRYIQQGHKAITFLKRIENDFPDYSNYGYVLFLIGYIYEDELKEFESARSYYELFIEKYPEHPLANDTKILIQRLGIPLEEIIKGFDTKNTN